jgi:arginine/ornithine N-succinyltransferase beta subunit
VSREGGASPQWRADGKELFFMAFDSTIMAATVTSTDHFESQTPHPLFSATLSTSTQGHQYSPSRDGSQFLVNLIDRQNTATPLTVVVNWPASVQR